MQKLHAVLVSTVLGLGEPKWECNPKPPGYFEDNFKTESCLILQQQTWSCKFVLDLEVLRYLRAQNCRKSFLCHYRQFPYKLALQGWSGGGRLHPVPSCQFTHGKKENCFLPLYSYEEIFNMWVRELSRPQAIRLTTILSSDPKQS